MTLSRRTLMQISAAAALLAPLPRIANAKTGGPEVGDDGLYIQDWFLESFLDLSDDLSTANESGKGCDGNGEGPGHQAFFVAGENIGFNCTEGAEARASGDCAEDKTAKPA